MLSKTARDAVRACLVLRGLPKERHAGADKISRTIGARPFYLSKILQALSRRGVLESKKGKGGGFLLGGSPERISLRDVLGPVERFPGPSECLFRDRPCPDNASCRIQCQWRPVRRAFDRFLSQTTLADVAFGGK